MWVWASTLQQVQDQSRNRLSCLPLQHLLQCKLYLHKPLGQCIGGSYTHVQEAASADWPCLGWQLQQGDQGAFDSRHTGQPAINSTYTCICADGCEPCLSYFTWGYLTATSHQRMTKQRSCVDAQHKHVLMVTPKSCVLFPGTDVCMDETLTWRLVQVPHERLIWRLPCQDIYNQIHIDPFTRMPSRDSVGNSVPWSTIRALGVTGPMGCASHSWV